MKQSTPLREELLQDAIGYLHSFREDCRSQSEHEDLTISLRLLSVLLKDDASLCSPFTLACYVAVGSSPARYLKQRQQRDEFKQRELIGAIPDYDPAEAKQVAEARKRRMRPLSIREHGRKHSARPV